MQKKQKQIWIESLKIEFPEYKEVIETLNWEIDHYIELIEDYHICKQQIKKLEEKNGSILFLKFSQAQKDLAEEIHKMLASRKPE
ncbi:hypothetical protein LCM02_10380 [Lutimonas saemankumensis]|uniref:hypothetical protein n=1 Tax=Lutimonas saemankumensis TaxID=483016 RepID=UPI001CD3E249|nr:hypothetical protein [Lutimonas saemankumensis]MCA0932857.1 hypothetical protein [Lutimonas saemankumensis]